MHKLAFVLVAGTIGAGAGSALAADAPFAPPAEYLPGWTGFYLGAQAGAGAVVNDVSLSALGAGNFNGIGGEGLLGSLFLGYNYQFSPRWVAGLQGEIGLANLETELNIAGTNVLDASPDLTAAISARLGYLTSPDTMLYVIGGWSYADYEVDITGTGGFSQSYDGYHVGTGVETRLSPNLTGRIEYRYTDLGGEDWGTGGFIDVEPSMHTATVGLAWTPWGTRGGAAFAPLPAMDWTGPYIGAYAGAGAIVNDVAFSLPPFFAGSFDGLGGEGIFAGGLVGYDVQTGGNWVFGIQADINSGGLESELNLGGLFSAEATTEATYSISGRIGYLTSPGTLLYALAGWTHTDYELDVPGFPGGGLSQDYDGFHAGAGMETRLTASLSARAEYRYTQFGGEDWGSGGLLDIEPSSHTGSLALVWRPW